MSEEDRTFNDEQREMFEQPEDAPVKTRPRTPGEPRANQSDLRRGEAEGDAQESET